MGRQWKIWDDWAGGGFFAGGSFNEKTRYNSVNMQRYQNGSIGPRPGWRRMTQIAGTGSSVPTFTTAKKNEALLGNSWTSTNYTGNPDAVSATLGTFIFVGAANADGTGRRIVPVADGNVHFFGSSPSYGGSTADFTPEVYSLNTARLVKDIVQSKEVFGPSTYVISTGSTGVVVGRSISGTTYYPRHIVFYRGRGYGWKAMSAALATNSLVQVSNTSSSIGFNSLDAAEFSIGGVSNAGEVVGLWPLASGILIYSYSGLSSSYTDYNTGVTGNRGTEVGQWYLLTGPNPASGTLTPLQQDVGPLWYELSIIYDGKVLFPIYQRGWAVHNGNSVDTNSLADLRPGRGSYATGTIWHNPVSNHLKPSLILPFYTPATDPTSEVKTNSDVIGEFYNTGYGAYEYVNGAWCEQLYNHGQGDMGPGISTFDGDKMVMTHMDSSDSGTTWFPQIYCRDVTLDRPSTSSVQNTHNPFSDANETAPTQAGGATGIMYHMLETGEFAAGTLNLIKPEAVVIDYDYWNSSLFDSDCGFYVELIYRSVTNAEKTTVRVNSARITPPGTSLEHYPKRGRAVLNMPARYVAGSVQVRLEYIVGCAINSISLAYDDDGVIR
jgi:hypothetical protein